MTTTDGLTAVLLAVALVLVAAVVLLVVRRLALARQLGAFDCLVRVGGVDTPMGQWRRGIARYDTNVLQWYATMTLGLSPSLTLDRAELRLLERFTAGPDEPRVPDGMSVVVGRYGNRRVAIAMAAGTASAFVLWVESGPPGRGVNVV